jgi:signal transduction histidine kinase
MSLLRFSSLRVRFAAVFLCFVAAGSISLVAWLEVSERERGLRQFEISARANGEFVRSARLPLSERTATALSQVLGIDVFFIRATDKSIGGKPAESRARSNPGIAVREQNVEAISVPMSQGVSMVFVREAEPAFVVLKHSGTWIALGGFWLAALALGWVITRGLVQPLRLLAKRLPHIENDPDAVLPGAERADEIGQVARAYLRARTQLGEERARREKAERLALLGKMAAGLAHEIHNPLTAIRMHAQLLEAASAGALPSAARDSLPTMIGESERIESLVNQWMFLARPEPPKTNRAELRQLVEKSVNAQSAAARHAGVEVSLGVSSSLVVEVDERRFLQAVTNVIVNAIQAMPEGGHLRIDALERNGRVVVRFADEGAGFSKAALARGGELFFSEKEGGMGIGLSVALEILKAHRGSLRVENGSAGGAVVLFDLPCPQPSFPSS